ncbi:hypothetical protein LCGC14_2131190, partial [marine sediment metagenome]
MNELFPKTNRLNLPDSDITYFPNFLDEDIANGYFECLKKEVPWQQDNIKVFGKVYPQPRLTALYANNGKPYSYANVTMQAYEFSDVLLKIKELIETKTDLKFTTCLLNRYRNGKDSNGWHADNEKELGLNPV